MGLPKTCDHIQIKIMMQNSSQEPPAFYKAKNEDLDNMDVFGNFKIKIESQILYHWCIKDQCQYSRQIPVRNIQCPQNQFGKKKLDYECIEDQFPGFWKKAEFCAFLSKTNLSQYQIWELSFFKLTFLSKTILSQNWVWELSLLNWAVLIWATLSFDWA